MCRSIWSALKISNLFVAEIAYELNWNFCPYFLLFFGTFFIYLNSEIVITICWKKNNNTIVEESWTPAGCKSSICESFYMSFLNCAKIGSISKEEKKIQFECLMNTTIISYKIACLCSAIASRWHKKKEEKLESEEAKWSSYTFYVT
jgi:hypothetical protein